MAIHPVFIHFHTGILAAAAAVALLNLLLRIAFKDNINAPGSRMARIFHQADVFLYVGCIIGFLGLIAGVVTGFMEPDYPLAVLEASAIMRFKILWSVVCMEIYLFLIIVRAKLGDRVWVKPSTYIPYATLILIGGAFMVIMGALGGLAVYGDSIMSPLLDWAGIPWP
ncbi:MAG: hypothetical protein E4H14_10305 [Candidatus Thorarchaeota archaeon]|nr:MAG: hypothetical protein E4H14_10305 [Candidatus Thorarchaeota archaeon]